MLNDFLNHHLKAFLIASLVSGVVAFIGVCLWVFVLTGAVALPAWVLAIWILANILLTVYAVAAIVLHALTLPAEAIGGITVVAGVALLFGGVMSITAGPGLVSLLVFLALAVMVVYDLYLTFADKHSKSSDEVKEEQTNG